MKITVETVVRGSLEEVWRAWTTPADILQWNAASPGLAHDPLVRGSAGGRHLLIADGGRDAAPASTSPAPIRGSCRASGSTVRSASASSRSSPLRRGKARGCGDLRRRSRRTRSSCSARLAGDPRQLRAARRREALRRNRARASPPPARRGRGSRRHLAVADVRPAGLSRDEATMNAELLAVHPVLMASDIPPPCGSTSASASSSPSG